MLSEEIGSQFFGVELLQNNERKELFKPKKSQETNAQVWN